MNRFTVSARRVLATISKVPLRRARISLLPFGLALVGMGCFLPSLQAQEVGYWHFDEKAPGNTIDLTTNAIIDSSGNGHNGTAGALIPYVAGSVAYGGTSALTFNTNSNDRILVPDAGVGAFNFAAGQSVTMEAVIRTINSGQGGSGNIISKQGAVSGSPIPGEWYFRVLNGKLRFSANDGSGLRTANGAAFVNDGQWHHVAAVYDASANQMRVYQDYVLQGSAATTFGSVIGNTNDLYLGQQNNGGAKFDGDIDFIRFSQGALDPTNFVKAITSVENFSPANGAIFLPATNVAQFTVDSSVGVAATNISVTVNGSNVTSQLVITGGTANWTVTLPPLVANALYDVNISVVDSTGFQVNQPWAFNTFATGDFSIEGEDYNFGGGQFIDNPVLSSADGPNSYLDRLGTEGIDFHQTNTPVLTQYRIGDLAGTAVCPDTLRQAYIDAKMADPGVADYMLRDNVDTEWLDYTRTFPAGTYHIYARLANPGTIPSVIQVDEVTAGSTTTAQTTSPIGAFRKTPTGSASEYAFAPLTDTFGHEASVSLSGMRTLRLTFVTAGANVNLNYLVFVPVGNAQPAFVASVSPAVGAGNVLSNSPIQISIRNADTTVNTGTIQLKLDAAAVVPTITPTGVGADIIYTPSPMTIGWHTAMLTFADSDGTLMTNQWQFFVANQNVLGYWKFNEGTPGSLASTNAGAILDASGNGRNGTVNSTMSYVAGSFNFGNSPALRFTTGPDHVVVPDPSGVFIFTNSFTLEAVIRSTNTATTSGAILAKNGTTDGEGEFWWRFPGASGGRQEVGMNNQLFVVGTNALNDGQWHHVAVVYNQTNNEVDLYADYVLEASGTKVFTAPIGRPADLFLGSFINGGSDLNGDVDLIRISSGALTTNQFVQTSVALQPVVSSLLPANGAVNVSPTPLIEAVLQNRDTSVAANSIKLFIDGADVTAGATNSAAGSTAQIDYVPAAPLASGPHTATITFQDTAVPANSWTNSWSFSTLSTIPVLALYQFNEKAAGELADTSAGAIVDSSGNGHNGTVFLTGDTNALVYVVGSTNYGATAALHFTYLAARTNIVTVPDANNAFNFTANQSITMEAIIRTGGGSQSGQGCLLAKQIADPGEWYWRIASTGLQRFSANNGEALKTVNSTTSLYDNQWHHVAAVYDASTKQMRVYRDYKLDCTPVTVPWTSPTALVGNTNEDLWIGAQQSGSSRFDGDIDQIRVTSAALDPSWFIPMSAATGVGSPVSLVNIVAGNGNVSFGFSTQSGRSYTVQSSPSLGADAVWTDLETVPGDGTVKSVTYGLSQPKEFFRVRTN
jgi:hypothetical protein